MNDRLVARRAILAAGMAGTAVSLAGSARAQQQPARPALAALPAQDVPRPELVMSLIVTCSNPERIGPSAASKDGVREDVWPIVGGRFAGAGISGTVVPGGGDFPVKRPDGVVVVDALYRLKTDDGVTIIIHNKGLAIPQGPGKWEKYRLVPEFIAPVGRYDWLNKGIFVSTLSEVPAHLALARSAAENDRLIQIFRIA